MYIVWNKR